MANVSIIATGGAAAPINSTNVDKTGVAAGVNTVVNTVVNTGKAIGNFFQFQQSASGANALGMQNGLIFPLDLVDPSSNRNFYMAIDFQQYVRRSIFDQPFLSPAGNIRLPIPNDLVDTQSVNWSGEAMGAATGAAIEAASQSLGGQRINSTNLGSTVTAGLQGAAGGAFVGGAIAGINAITPGQPAAPALSLAGMAENPFLTMLFKSPQFKTHRFSWKFSPTNAPESYMLKNIINTFRANMLPSLTQASGGTLLGYPNIAIIKLYPNDEFLYKFKPCAVQNISMNFAPGNAPAFFKGSNAPVEVTMTVELQEIEYWLQEDVTGDSRGGGAFTSQVLQQAGATNVVVPSSVNGLGSRV